MQAPGFSDLDMDAGGEEDVDMGEFVPEEEADGTESDGCPLEGRALLLSKLSIGCLELLIQNRECVLTFSWHKKRLYLIYSHI